MPSLAPQPKDRADVLQQKLQQKFAAQRRKDMLAMQASQASKAADENEEVPKADNVPETTKQSPKKLLTRAKRSERRRKLEEAALGKKAIKRSKKTQAKRREESLDEVAEITTSMEPRATEEQSISVEASVRKSQETLGAEGKETNKSSRGNVRGEQTVNAQKLDDIMDILESSKNQKKPELPEKLARKVKISSRDTKPKAAVVATLNDLPNSGERPDVDARKTAAILSYYNDQLLAHLKANPDETTESLHHLRVIIHISSNAI